MLLSSGLNGNFTFVSSLQNKFMLLVIITNNSKTV